MYLVADLAMAVTEQTFPHEVFDMDAVEIYRGRLLDATEI